MLKFIENNKILSFIIILSIIALTTIAVQEYLIKNVFLLIDNEKMVVETTSNTIEELLDENNINLDENDKINIDPNEKVKDGMKIQIEKAMPVIVQVDDTRRTIKATKQNIRNLLNNIGIKLGEYDKVTPSLDTDIKPNLVIDITRVNKQTFTEEKEISYQSITKNSDTLEKGKAKKIQTGEDGIKRIEIERIYENGELVAETILNESIVKEPVPQIIEKGTKDYFVSSRGVTSYRKSFIAVATAYDLSYESIGKNPGDKNFGITASGTQARPGVVAVDPSVIPLGTKLYIQSLDGSKDYGFAVAEDTGGAIKANRIDLFFEDHSKALKFGRRKVKVYILD